MSYHGTISGILASLGKGGGIRLDGGALRAWREKVLKQSRASLEDEVDIEAGTLQRLEMGYGLARFRKDSNPHEVHLDLPAAEAHTWLSRLSKILTLAEEKEQLKGLLEAFSPIGEPRVSLVPLSLDALCQNVLDVARESVFVCTSAALWDRETRERLARAISPGVRSRVLLMDPFAPSVQELAATLPVEWRHRDLHAAGLQTVRRLVDLRQRLAVPDDIFELRISSNLLPGFAAVIDGGAAALMAPVGLNSGRPLDHGDEEPAPVGVYWPLDGADDATLLWRRVEELWLRASSPHQWLRSMGVAQWSILRRAHDHDHEQMTLCFVVGEAMHGELLPTMCPSARPVGVATLRDHRLVARSEGDVLVAAREGSEVHGRLWRLAERDLMPLHEHLGLDAALRCTVTVHRPEGPAEAQLDGSVTPISAVVFVAVDAATRQLDEAERADVARAIARGAADAGFGRRRVERILRGVDGLSARRGRQGTSFRTIVNEVFADQA